MQMPKTPFKNKIHHFKNYLVFSIIYDVASFKECKLLWVNFNRENKVFRVFKDVFRRKIGIGISDIQTYAKFIYFVS